VLGVPALSKPAFSACSNCRSRGCSIYNERPDECRAFVCGWLEGVGATADRPDRSGVVLSVVYSEALRSEILQVHEVWPDAARGDRASRLIARAVASGILGAVIRADGSRSIFGPPELADRARIVVESAGLPLRALTERG
jgi:hypothetical protein